MQPELHSSTHSTCSLESPTAGRQECAAEDAPRDEVRSRDAKEGEHQLETGSTDSPSAAETSSQGAEELSHGGPSGVTFVPYESELQLPHIMRLMKADLSEPYSIYTYRYFIHNWPNLCFLVGWRVVISLCTCLFVYDAQFGKYSLVHETNIHLPRILCLDSSLQTS